MLVLLCQQARPGLLCVVSHPAGHSATAEHASSRAAGRADGQAAATAEEEQAGPYSLWESLKDSAKGWWRSRK